MQLTSATVANPSVPQSAEATPGFKTGVLSPGQSTVQSGTKSGRNSSLGSTKHAKSFDAPSK